MSLARVRHVRQVLVTGARGKTGREVVRLLADRPDVTVRAGSSRPGAATRFDWADPATWPAATAGVDAIYLVRPDLEDAPALIGELLKVAPDRARVVLLSEQRIEAMPPEAWAHHVEAAVTGASQAWTLLRPSWFTQVFTDKRYFLDAIRDQGVLPMPVGDAPIAWIDTRDIAAAAVVALLEPGHAGHAYDLTGPAAVSCPDVAERITAARGRVVRHVSEPLEAVLEAVESPWMQKILREVYEGVIEGRFATVTDEVERLTGHAPRTVGSFVAEHAYAWQGPSPAPAAP